MLTDSFAPIKRASLFFGCMGIAVAALTFGAGLQQVGSENTIAAALAKAEQHQSGALRVAAVDAAQRQISPARRAIATSQQAMLQHSPDIVLR